MVEADFRARVMWVPNAIKHNKPESPNVVRSWAAEFDLIPECDLKWKAFEALKASIHALGEAYGKAFDETFAKPSGKPSAKPSPKTSPNQEQEQEQEQEPPSGVQGGKPPKPPAFEIPDWMPPEPWAEFVEMRRAKGKRAPFTVAAAKGIVGDVDRLRSEGHDPTAVLRQSVVNGWSGVFPPKAGQPHGQQARPESFV